MAITDVAARVVVTPEVVVLNSSPSLIHNNLSRCIPQGSFAYAHINDIDFAVDPRQRPPPPAAPSTVAGSTPVLFLRWVRVGGRDVLVHTTSAAVLVGSLF